LPLSVALLRHPLSPRENAGARLFEFAVSALKRFLAI